MTEYDSHEQAFFCAELGIVDWESFSPCPWEKAFLDELDQIVEERVRGSSARLRLYKVAMDFGIKLLTDDEGNLVDDINYTWSKSHLEMVVNNRISLAAGRQEYESATEFSVMMRPAFEVLLQGDDLKAKTEKFNERWEAAASSLNCEFNGVLTGANRFVALRSSPIWELLGSGEGGWHEDSLCVPYPPFYLNSGAIWKTITRKECIELGLLDE